MKYPFFLLFLLIIFSCKSSNQKDGAQTVTPIIEYPEEIKNMFDAHGGLDKWKQQSSLSYHFTSGEKKEIHTIDLRNRKALINGDGYDIGFDGSEAWISPDKTNYPNANPRFYHNLYFYFHSLVFLAADHGIHYDVREVKHIDGQEFIPISITYGSGVGDSPDDEYILFLDPISYQLKQIMYTVTYFSGEKSSRYSGIKYTQWVTKDGLLLPSEMRGYKIENDGYGEERYMAQFTDLVLSVDPPEQQIFEIPEIAIIDTLK